MTHTGAGIFSLSSELNPLTTNWCFRVWGTIQNTNWQYQDCSSYGFTELPTPNPTPNPVSKVTFGDVKTVTTVTVAS